VRKSWIERFIFFFDNGAIGGEEDMKEKKCVVLGILSIRDWIDAYETALNSEKRLIREIARLQKLQPTVSERKTTIGAAFYQEVMRKIKEKEEKLDKVRKNRLKLEWAATLRIMKRQWPLSPFTEYDFARDLSEIARIKKHQTLAICKECEECQQIRVLREGETIPLSGVVRKRGLPFSEITKLTMIFSDQGGYRVVRKVVSEEQLEWYKNQFSTWKSLLNWYTESTRIPLHESIVVKTLKYGCHRSCTRENWGFIDFDSCFDLDSEPGAPDHFPEDLIWEVSPEGEVVRAVHSSQHGSEEN
jgi:hypothetical protein